MNREQIERFRYAFKCQFINEESVDQLCDLALRGIEAGKCTYCGGNDRDMPCAYPSEKKPGCLRDTRLYARAKTNQCGETCERAKLCYACGKALEESNARIEPGEPVAWEVWQPLGRKTITYSEAEAVRCMARADLVVRPLTYADAAPAGMVPMEWAKALVQYNDNARSFFQIANRIATELGTHALQTNFGSFAETTSRMLKETHDITNRARDMLAAAEGKR